MSQKNNTARMYREAAVRGASPVGLVVILYEEALRALRRAEAAMDRGDIEERTNSISHAIQVIGYLQFVLDFERGGAVARQLSSFYNYCRGKMLEASVKNSPDLLAQLVSDFADSTEAWREVERALAAAPHSPQSHLAAPRSAPPRSAEPSLSGG
jgi:flagellar protein FliS